MNRHNYAQRDCDRIVTRRRRDARMRRQFRIDRGQAMTASERFAAIATVTILAAIPFAIFYVATN